MIKLFEKNNRKDQHSIPVSRKNAGGLPLPLWLSLL